MQQNDVPEQFQSSEYYKLLLAQQEIAECQRDLSRVLIQGTREDNNAARGNVAVGLLRAAYHITGKVYGEQGK